MIATSNATLWVSVQWNIPDRSKEWFLDSQQNQFKDPDIIEGCTEGTTWDKPHTKVLTNEWGTYACSQSSGMLNGKCDSSGDLLWHCATKSWAYQIVWKSRKKSGLETTSYCVTKLVGVSDMLTSPHFPRYASVLFTICRTAFVCFYYTSSLMPIQTSIFIE